MIFHTQESASALPRKAQKCTWQKDPKKMETQSPLSENATERQGRQKRRKHPLFKAFFALLLFLIVVQTVFYFFATPLIKSIVQQKVHEKTDGLYSFEFDYISVDLSSRSFYLTGARLIPDTALYNRLNREEKINSGLYDIKTASFGIKGLRLIDYFWRDKFNVSAMQLTMPKIRIIGTPKKVEREGRSLDPVHEDLYPILSKYFTQLTINELVVTDGYFDFYRFADPARKSAAARNISLILTRFYLDKQEYLRKNRLFYSDDIQVKFNDYVLLLNDSLHKFSAKEVYVSTGQSRAYAKGVAFEPDTNALLYHSHKTEFGVRVPQLVIRGFDANKFYFDQVLDLGAIELLEPQMHIVSGKKQEGSKTADYFQNEQLYELIRGHLNYLYVDSFVITRGKFTLHRSQKSLNPDYLVNSLTVRLDHFLLDPHSNTRKNKLFYSDDIEVIMSGFQMRTRNQAHKLYAQELMASSRQDIIISRNLQLIPQISDEAARNKHARLQQIRIPHMILNGVNLRQAYNNQSLTINNFIIQDPVLDLKSYESKDTTNQAHSRLSFFAIFSELVERVSISRTSIENGMFKWENHRQSGDKEYTAFSSGRVNVSLHNLNLSTDFDPKQGLEEWFNAREAEMKLSDYRMKISNNMHVLEIKDLILSTNRRTITFAQLRLRPDTGIRAIEQLKRYKASGYFDIHIPYIEFSGADPTQVLFARRFDIDSFRIDKPEIALFYFDELNNATEPGSTGSSDTTQVSESTYPSDSMLIELNKLVGGYIDSSKLTHIRLHQTDTSPGIGNPILVADTIGTLIGAGKWEQMMNVLGRYIEVFNINNLILNEGSFYLLGHSSSGAARYLLQNDISLKIKDFKLTPDSVDQTNNRISSSQVDITLRNISFRHPRLPVLVLINRADYSLSRKQLTVSAIKLTPFSNEKNSPSILTKLTVPQIVVRGIDLRQCLNRKEVNARSITLLNPDIALTLPSAENSTTLDTSTLLIAGLTGLSADSLIVENGNISITNNTIQHDIRIAGGRFNLLGTGLRSDTGSVFSVLEPEQVFKSLDIQFFNPIYESPDSTFALMFDTLTVSLVPTGISFSRLRLLPRKQTSNSKTHIKTLQIAHGRIIRLNLPAWIIDKNLIIDSVSLETPYLRFENDQPPRAQIYSGAVLLQMRPPGINKVNISCLNISRGSIINLARDSTKQLSADFSLAVASLAIDSAAVADTSRFIPASTVHLTFHNIIRPTKDSLYRMRAANLSLLYPEQTIHIDTFGYRPVMTRENMLLKLQTQKAVTRYTFFNIVVRQVNLRQLNEKQGITGKKLSVDGAIIESFKDKNLPFDTSFRPPMLTDMFSRIPMQFFFDTVSLKNGIIAYTEIAPGSTTEGSLFIDRINLNALNTGNDSAQWKSRHTLAHFTGYLMGKSYMSIEFSFDFGADLHPFKAEGLIEALQLSELNPFFEKALFTSIKDGRLNFGKFNFTGNDEFAEGKLRFKYKNLRLAILQTDPQAAGDRPLATLVINGLIRNNNPKPGGLIAREGQIYFERDPSRSIFHFWINSVVSGIKSTLGFNTREMKRRMKQRDKEQSNKKILKNIKLLEKYRKERADLNEKARIREQRRMEREEKRRQKDMP